MIKRYTIDTQSAKKFAFDLVKTEELIVHSVDTKEILGETFQDPVMALDKALALIEEKNQIVANLKRTVCTLTSRITDLESTAKKSHKDLINPYDEDVINPHTRVDVTDQLSKTGDVPETTNGPCREVSDSLQTTSLFSRRSGL